jgi:hypothetical protein
MDLLAWMTLVALSGPFLGIGAVIADAHSGGRPITRRRFILAGMIGGMLTVGALGLLIEIAPEHPPGFLLGTAAGASYGTLVGLIAAALRPSVNISIPPPNER